MADKIRSKEFNLDQFVQELEKVQVNIKQNDIDPNPNQNQSQNINLKDLTRDMVQNNINKFSFVLNPNFDASNTARRIERIYSKNEIRKMVCDHLIPEYQHEAIINAVTEYIYGVHVTA